MTDEIYVTGEPGEEGADQAPAAGLEALLAGHEAGVDELLKSLGKLKSAMAAWKKASAEGDLAKREKAAALAVRLAAELAEPVASVAGSWRFDVDAYLAGDAWLNEVITELKARHGIQGRTDHAGALVCPPLVVRADPARQRLKVLTRPMGTIRPSVVAAALRKECDKVGDSNSVRFIESLYTTTRRLAHAPNCFATFRQIYDLYSETPGWKQANSMLEFGLAVHALVESGVRATRTGKRCHIDGPSGGAKERDVITVTDRDGRTCRYWGIGFDD